jgi:CHAD domain-containing protein
MSNVIEIDQHLVEQSHVLRQRAVSLRHQAEALTTPLASAYRRRASELEFEAWIAELQAGVPYDQVQPAA